MSHLRGGHGRLPRAAQYGPDYVSASKSGHDRQGQWKRPNVLPLADARGSAAS